jgi:hypothetical protein
MQFRIILPAANQNSPKPELNSLQTVTQKQGVKIQIAACHFHPKEL